MSKSQAHTGIVAKAALSHFATLLRVRRKERKLTLDELADRLGISTPTVRKMLDGAASVVIEIEEVFVARMASGPIVSSMGGSRSRTSRPAVAVGDSRTVTLARTPG